MKKFIKVFWIVMVILCISSISLAGNQCVITPDMETTWVKVVDIDRSGNPLNNGWPLFDGVLSRGERIGVNSTYGHVTIHYQTKSAGKTYVMTDQYCNNNLITVP